jgi:hypothetical protein
MLNSATIWHDWLAVNAVFRAAFMPFVLLSSSLSLPGTPANFTVNAIPTIRLLSWNSYELYIPHSLSGSD